MRRLHGMAPTGHGAATPTPEDVKQARLRRFCALFRSDRMTVDLAPWPLRKRGATPAWTVGDDGCWNWNGFVTPAGYGQIKRDGRIQGAHRYIYQLVHGPLDDGMVLDHLCENTKCVNPAHLEPVTTRENILRGGGITVRYLLRETCPNGHPWDSSGPRGSRRCSVCYRERQREYEHASKARKATS